MGVGQPLSMKLKNVHLPHPHPNGVFRDTSLGGGLVQALCFITLSVGFSKVATSSGAPESDVPCGVVLLSWVRISV